MKKYLLLVLVVLACKNFIQAENKLPKVYLNHVSIVLDDVTFRGIAKSAFMTKKFANADAGLPKFVLPNDTSGLLYIRGKNTYVEIINANSLINAWKPGDINIAFSAEQPNAAQQIYDSLFPALSPAKHPDSVNINGKQVANEYYFGMPVSDMNTLFTYGIQEYHPDLMQALYKKSFAGKPIKRSDFLKKRYNADKLLTDITEINLEITEQEATRFLETLKKLDFNVSEKNNSYVAKGNEIVFRIKITNELQPKLQLKLKLNAPKDGNYNLNNSKLEFDGSYATWKFY